MCTVYLRQLRVRGAEWYARPAVAARVFSCALLRRDNVARGLRRLDGYSDERGRARQEVRHSHWHRYAQRANIGWRQLLRAAKG